MIKKSAIFLVFFFLLLAKPVKAYDLEVVCDATSCSPNSSPAIFPASEIWYPGKSLSKTIRVKNNGSSNNITISTESKNAVSDSSLCQLDKQQLILSIVRINSVPPNSVVWSGYLKDFYNSSPIALAIFSPNSYDDFIYTVYMRSQAGNECQDKSTKFDLILNFISEDITPPPTPTPTTAAGGGGGGAGAGVSAAVCNDTPPGSAPTLLSAVAGTNSVTLTWTQAIDPVSYYLIAYGTSSGNYIYGNPNIGGKGTTSFTVSNLSGGITYYFVVRAGNGCKPGPFSNELFSTPGGGVVYGIAPGFQENVEGIATTSAELSPTKAEKEKIKGAATATVCERCIWWQILLAEFIALIVYFRAILKKYKIKRPVLKAIIIPIITYLIFLWLNKNCVSNLITIRSTSIFCRYFILFDMAIYLIYSYVRKKSVVRK